MWYQVQHPLLIEQLWVNFLPSWWNRNYGVTFGERLIFDPDYRVEVHRFAERTVADRFPGLGIGSPDARPGVVQPEFGNATTPALAGCEIIYPEDNHPCNLHLPAERIAALRVPEDLTQAFPYREVIDQVAYLNRKLNLDQKPVLATRGVLNDAMLIQGTSVFLDLAGEPNGAAPMLDYGYEVLTRLMDLNHRQFTYRGQVWVANCTTMMIHPETYGERILPYDLRIQALAVSLGQDFGIHHCGVLDAWLEPYRRIPRVHWMEIGWGSDLRRALETFPEASIQYVFSPTYLKSASVDQIREWMQQFLDSARGHWHRTRLSVPDIEYGTPEENIDAIHACLRSADA